MSTKSTALVALAGVVSLASAAAAASATAEGSEPRNLTRNAANDGDHVWSPDGRKTAFTSNRDGNGEIYVMDADGSG